MSDTASVIPMKRDVGIEDRRANTRRVVHEFAVYAIWHLSFTKPDSVAIRTLVNDMLHDWLGNEFSCGDPTCGYCIKSESIANRTGFRSMFRNLIGRSDRKGK